jgi:hypothetical protein
VESTKFLESSITHNIFVVFWMRLSSLGKKAQAGHSFLGLDAGVEEGSLCPKVGIIGVEVPRDRPL